MNVLVLGGDGYLGSHFVDQAVALGHTVTVFDRFPYDVSRNLEHQRGNVRFVSGEFTNRSSLLEATEGQDIVYHFVGMTNPAASWEDPSVEVEGNLAHTIRLLEILCEQGVPKIVFPSSGGTVYGSKCEPAAEDSLPRPFSPYGIAKIATEYFLDYFNIRSGLAYDVYRIGNAYGSRQPVGKPQGVVAAWMHAILEHRTVRVYGDDSVRRDYVYVRDIAYLMTHSLGSLILSGVFNLGTGIGTSIIELLRIFGRTIDTQFEHEVLPRRPFDNASIVLDSGKLLAEFPGFTFGALEEKIPETWDEMKRQYQQKG